MQFLQTYIRTYVTNIYKNGTIIDPTTSSENDRT